MDLTWNLDKIYTSFDSEKFKDDIKQFEKYIVDINKLDIDNCKNDKESSYKIQEFLSINNEYKRLYIMLYSYTYLIANADFENVEAINILDDIENKNSDITEAYVKFSRWLRNIKNLDKIIEESSYLLEHKFYLKELLLKSKYLLSEKEELIISKMQSSGSKAWEKLYMELIGTTTTDITINGIVENLTISEIRNIAYEKNAMLRKTAYYSEVNLCKKISQVCCTCLNEINGEALTIYEMRGYKSPLEKVLIESRMDFKTLNVMVSAIRESLPMFHKYFCKKAEMLGHKAKIPFYDIYAPINESSKKLSYMDAENLIVSGFKTFSEKMSCFAKKAFENKWIDAESRKNKSNFGLSVDIFPIKESRIITNFSGNYIDVTVLAHELGHAYHSSNLFGESMLNTDYPTPIAETASIFCETIINNELLKKLTSNEALVILERSISDAAYYIVDFYGRYLFENELFKRRKSGSLSCEELNELMAKCMAKAYGNSIESETIHPYMWMNKVGYFMSGNEFLNFPYSFGVIFSKGLYAEYIKRGQGFVEEYDEFLSKTSKNNIVDIAKTMNIDVHSTEFWKNSLKIIERDIEKFISIE